MVVMRCSVARTAIGGGCPARATDAACVRACGARLAAPTSRAFPEIAGLLIVDELEQMATREHGDSRRTPRKEIPARQRSRALWGAARKRARAASASFRRLTRRATSADEALPADFWALKDVNVDIDEGEVVGIIGRNGAGKSTLLKILSRITEPTGLDPMCGRVGSLLEVGTGFHPELTGRENIFLNGAILGMSRAEIRGEFDDIVAFADSRSSSIPGQTLFERHVLAAGVCRAAHLEPEILLDRRSARRRRPRSSGDASAA